MDDMRRHSAGKGDKPRPIDYQKWSENWDRIFGNKKNESKRSKKSSGKDRIELLRDKNTDSNNYS